MCCIFTILVFLGPRFAGLIWWIAQPARWVGATNVSAFTSWIWPVLGLVFVPWTTLMYVIVAPGGIVGFDWVWLGLSLVADIASYSGGAYGNRNRLGYGR
jgi:hypothetical protein